MVQKFPGIPVKAGKVLPFFRKLSTGMNRSIWIRPGITKYSIQIVSAQENPDRAKNQSDCRIRYRALVEKNNGKYLSYEEF